MKFVCRSRCLTAWIAIFAVLLAALAPSVSQALASSRQQSTTWTEICTSMGMQVRQDLAPITGSGEREGIMSKHCPFCLNHACHFVLPTTPLEYSLAIDASTAFSCSSVTTSSPRFAFTSPQSRAPPVLS
jgi:hypothetical protein